MPFAFSQFGGLVLWKQLYLLQWMLKVEALISSQQRRAHLLDGGGVVQALRELAFGGGRRPQGGRKERALPGS